MSETENHSGATILLIDDQPTNLSLLVEYLERRSLEVVVAENGLSGITRAKYVLPEIILLDVMMPGIDGYETCRRLKNDPRTAAIPVIFMTALTDINDTLKGFKAGGVDYITKPVQFDEVWARVNAHLTISHLRKNLEQQHKLLQLEIEQRRKAAEEIRRQNDFMNTVINSLPHPFFVIDATNYEVVMANKKAAPHGMSEGETCHEMAHLNATPCNGSKELCPLIQIKETGNPVTVEHTHMDREGREKNVEVHAFPIFSAQGEISQVIEYILDISERKQLEQHLKTMAITDSLTGLHNRRGLITLTEKFISLAHRQHCSLYLIYLDLNDLKQINDSLGHKAGDEVIVETAQILKETFRQSDILSRIGGDEFAVVLKDEDNEHNEESITQRLYENLQRRNSRNPGIPISVSAGVARYDPDSPITIDELLSTADSRMYACKKRMKGAG